MDQKDGLFLFQIDIATKITLDHIVVNDLNFLSLMDGIEVRATPLQSFSCVQNGVGELLPVSATSKDIYYKIHVADLICELKKIHRPIPNQLRSKRGRNKYYIFKGCDI